MRLSMIITSTFAVVASAAPSYPKVSVKDARSAVDTLGHLSDYFNLVAYKVQAARVSNAPPVCDLSNAHMPTIPDGLPPPSEGLKVHHVAVGRGTQNYTCDTTDPSSAPTLAGAVAVLFNATCVASLYPDLLDKIPGMAVHFNLTNAHQLGPSMLPVSGVHYFTNGTTPFFDLEVQGQDIGDAPCAKNASAPAPSNAAVGQLGEAAVPWLKLNTREGATGNMKEVYRVTTAGGSAPKTCEGMPAAFEVQYATVYWFWEGETKDE